jgi:hypothetical protein
MRIGRTAAAVALVGLLGMAGACGKAADSPAAAGGDQPAGATKTTAAAAKKGGGSVDAGMQAACDVVHQMFGALDSGDKAKAEQLKTTSGDMFQTITDYTAGPDKQLASNAEAMASLLDDLPEAPIYQSGLADTYKVDCVRQYGAAPLKG